AGRMAKVIDGVRIFSRDESEQDSATSDINESITNVMTLLEQQFRAHDIHVCVNCHEGNLLVNCSLGRLEQVLINLLVNSRQSLDASEYGYKEIVITTMCQGDNACLTVEDNGPGIDKNAFPHIFDPFYTTKEIGQGTGLGLSICKAIVNGAGGDIEVSNKYARGCIFQITMPLVEPQNEDTAD
ncbi:MAG: HAMP domain-containing histidine kinase, partial [Desulfovibrio sp.]|uniref:sensor histidine kinase n=1 Tax=Desulfovibrio sp. TaxID=885 RepID=UPI0025901950